MTKTTSGKGGDTVGDHKPVKIIAGTDWWTDCDDAVALRVLARAQQRGDIELLGVAVNACMEDSAPSLDAYLSLEGLPNLPLGIDLAATDYGGKPPYQRRLAALPGSRSNAQCEDGVRLYRRLLARSEESVDIIEIGFQQILANLLLSGPDEFSPLTGEQLVRQKVRKLWAMAGRWDNPEGGFEHNLAKTPRARAAAHLVCQRWPSPVCFLGFEVGESVITGGGLPEGDPLRQILIDHGTPAGRCSWDPMLALLAVIGDERAAGYGAVRGRARVDAQSGKNTFVPDENGSHSYVVKEQPDAFYRQSIDAVIRP